MRSYVRQNRRLAWLQMNRLSSGNNQSKFKTSGNLPIILEESKEYSSKKKTGRCQHVTGRILTVYAQKLLGHWWAGLEEQLISSRFLSRMSCAKLSPTPRSPMHSAHSCWRPGCVESGDDELYLFRAEGEGFLPAFVACRQEVQAS